MKKVIALGVALVVLGFVGPTLAQAQKASEAQTAQLRAEPKLAAIGLVQLLESKGILTGAEAAIVSDAQLQPQVKQLLAELLRSKQLITEQEYVETIETCSSAPSPAAAAATSSSPTAAGTSKYRQVGEMEPGRPRMSLSEWMTWILPGGMDSRSTIDFGTIQPEPPRDDPPADQPKPARAQKAHKSHKHHGQDASQTAPDTEASAPKQ